MQESTNAISWERDGDTTVVCFTTDTVSELGYAKRASDELRQLAEQVGGNMLFSLANVRFMSSPGISVLIDLNRRLRLLEGRLKICELHPMVRQLFRSFGLEKALEIHSSREDAMQAFRDRPTDGDGASE